MRVDIVSSIARSKRRLLMEKRTRECQISDFYFNRKILNTNINNFLKEQIK